MESAGNALGYVADVPAYIACRNITDEAGKASNELLNVPDAFIAKGASASNAIMAKGSSIWYYAKVTGSVSLSPMAAILERAEGTFSYHL